MIRTVGEVLAAIAAHDSMCRIPVAEVRLPLRSLVFVLRELGASGELYGLNEDLALVRVGEPPSLDAMIEHVRSGKVLMMEEYRIGLLAPGEKDQVQMWHAGAEDGS